MILACPHCAARFLIADDAIGTGGRDVRCGRCSHTWSVDPPATATLSAADPSPMRSELHGAGVAIEPEPTDATDTPAPDLSADPPPRDEARIEVEERRQARIDARRGGAKAGAAGLPAIRKPPRRWPARLAWLFVVLVVMGIAAAASHYRDQVIAAWPAAEPLYAAVGMNKAPLGFGLDLVIVESDQASVGGKPVLMITGRIENKTNVARDVPDLRASLFDERERELRHWTFPAPVPTLPPNQTVGFKTELKDPPTDAVRLSIIFHEAK